MPRRMQHLGFQIADPECLAVLEQMVELLAIGMEGFLRVEDRLEDLLHVADVLADGGAAADLRLEIRGGGQVVGMGVGLQDPVDRQFPRPDMAMTESAEPVPVRPDFGS